MRTFAILLALEIPMKKLFIATLLTVSCSSTMADNKFSGFYGGVSLGYVEGEDTNKEFNDGDFEGYTAKNEPSGSTVGLIGGYNWTVRHNLVLGIEADYTFNNADDKSLYLYEGEPDEGYSLSVKLEDSLSIRGRAGYLFNSNETMVYITAGYSSIELDRRYFDGGESQSSKDREDGWVAGLGVEHMLGETLSLQTEYRYADYGDKTISPDEIYADDITEKQSYKEQSLRVAIIYNF
jgi:outer membrane immunogenic protein